METRFGKVSVLNAMDMMDTMECIDVVHSTNHFSANGWSYEVAEKYLFSFDGNLVEAGYYMHYDNETMGRLVKRVIELPTSYGCPMKCAYCASSFIDRVSPLSLDTLCSITNTMIDLHKILNDSKILIALTGTGDAYYTLNLISEYIFQISQKYDNLYFTISSCYWTDMMLKTVEKLSREYNIRNIQSTFVSTNEETVSKIIPGLMHTGSSMLGFVDYIANSSLNNWRINYLMLHSVNDDDESFDIFVKMIKPIRKKVIVRISSLNETMASICNGIKPAPFHRSEALRNMLAANGINSYLFCSEHNDNMNCGQLVLEEALAKSKTSN
jgi:adenine C2-methylase RlmN of 23S rRNA A2503 and tRNA A37